MCYIKSFYPKTWSKQMHLYPLHLCLAERGLWIFITQNISHKNLIILLLHIQHGTGRVPEWGFTWWWCNFKGHLELLFKLEMLLGNVFEVNNYVFLITHNAQWRHTHVDLHLIEMYRRRLLANDICVCVCVSWVTRATVVCLAIVRSSWKGYLSYSFKHSYVKISY